ncbi:MAG: hypothetical protein COT92_00845 [Candidatus Doudnabacteria bacterium CG10_big_fil_rev_8_21_14_0_10_42_18]|uniref:Carbonic anhydrase n=1 Tax=Candidatus Doudnabacteria bacterium CG10_big_fil_rev_8_21_14_0_10_42_18 TaxID=1974552 RepID=A0A2H0VBK1_9BACT|nr:MAG: hypothetical protein COT92_00845 [Candidatus Doudnabacteria bacterium CG10_big_fil_rev_8_21_14_0_10_42_18]
MSGSGLVFTSHSAFSGSKQANILFIACSDFRFRKAFLEFQRDYLKEAEIDRIIAPGGVLGFFAERYGYLETGKAMEYWTKFLGEHDGAGEVVLVGHEDCAVYANAPKLKGQSGQQLIMEQREDLIAAGQLIANLFPQARIRIFFASIDAAENKVMFSEMA